MPPVLSASDFTTTSSSCHPHPVGQQILLIVPLEHLSCTPSSPFTSSVTALLCLLPGLLPYMCNYIFASTIILLQYRVGNVALLFQIPKQFLIILQKVYLLGMVLSAFQPWNTLTFLLSTSTPYKHTVHHTTQAQCMSLIFAFVYVTS